MSRNTLPPLSYYPLPQGIDNEDYSNNLPIIRSQTPIMDNYNNNINTNNYIASQNMMKEIRELKNVIKKSIRKSK